MHLHVCLLIMLVCMLRTSYYSRNTAESEVVLFSLKHGAEMPMFYRAGDALKCSDCSGAQVTSDSIV